MTTDLPTGLIRTDRLHLRAYAASDEAFFVDLYARPEVRRHIGDGRPQTPAQVREGLRQRAAYDEDPVLGWWLVETPEGRPLGTLVLKDIPASGTGGAPSGDIEVGWHLHPDAHGQGYATEAARALVEQARAHGIPRLVAVTHPDNHGSQAVARRLGMQPLGRTERYYDTETELFVLELTRDDLS